LENGQSSLLKLVDTSTMPLQYNQNSFVDRSRSCSMSHDIESAGILLSEDIYSDSFDRYMASARGEGSQHRDSYIITERYRSMSSSMSTISGPIDTCPFGEPSPSPTRRETMYKENNNTNTDNNNNNTFNPHPISPEVCHPNQKKTTTKNNNSNGSSTNKSQKQSQHPLARFNTLYRVSAENCDPEYYDDPWSHQPSYDNKGQTYREFPHPQHVHPTNTSSSLYREEYNYTVDDVLDEQLSLEEVSKLKRVNTLVGKGIRSNSRKHKRKESSTLQKLREKNKQRPLVDRHGFLKHNVKHHTRKESNILQMLRNNGAPRRNKLERNTK